MRKDHLQLVTSTLWLEDPTATGRCLLQLQALTVLQLGSQQKGLPQ
jgi:hypothetical protein